METQKKQKQSAKPQKTKSVKVVSITLLSSNGMGDEFLILLSNGEVWEVNRDRKDLERATWNRRRTLECNIV